MIFYHGSSDNLTVGTILVPRDKDYESDWKDTGFYGILEKYRPVGMIAHKDAVFMCGNDDDLDCAGGGTDYVFTLQPLGPVEKHSFNWGSDINCLSENSVKNAALIEEAAKNYWQGVPHHSEDVWEYLTTSAKILAVEEY